MLAQEMALSKEIEDASSAIRIVQDGLFKALQKEKDFIDTEIKFPDFHQKIFINAVRCRECGSIAVSKNQHHYNNCRCGFNAADGGQTYLRRAGLYCEEISLYTYDVVETSPDQELLISAQLARFTRLDVLIEARIKATLKEKIVPLTQWFLSLLTVDEYIDVYGLLDAFLMYMRDEQKILPKGCPKPTYARFINDVYRGFYGEKPDDYVPDVCNICYETSEISRLMHINKVFIDRRFESNTGAVNMDVFTVDMDKVKTLLESCDFNPLELRLSQERFDLFYAQFVQKKLDKLYVQEQSKKQPTIK
jgi:hypothetical protein